MTNDVKPLLQVRNLRKYFPVRGRLFRTVQAQVKAVDDVSFELMPGQTLGLVGESGCGKSTLGRALLRLHEPTSGEVLFNNEGDMTDVASMDKAELLKQRREMQMIFQDPFASLSPRRTVAQTLLEPLETHGIGTAAEREDKLKELMKTVGLRPQVLHRYPHEFSGGQRQRIGIARALTLNPKFIVADEPVSALDVSVQSQVLNLIKELQEEQGISFLFVSHDLAVIQHVSDVVAVMYLGSIVEMADAGELFANPKHPYTQALLSAIPVPDPKTKSKRIILGGDVPSPMNPPTGCPFHPRCSQATDACRSSEPVQTVVSPPDTTDSAPDAGPHTVSCHLYAP